MLLGCQTNPTQELLQEFLVDRVPPFCREDYKNLCRRRKILEGNCDEYLKISHGLHIDDDMWIRFPGEQITWRQIDPRARKVPESEA